MKLTTNSLDKNNYSLTEEYLRSFADTKYRQFHLKLIPDYEPNKFLGVRMPVLRRLAREISRSNPKDFVKNTPTDFYEEIMLRGIVIGLIKTESLSEFKGLVNSQLKYIDNWALCDCFCNSLKETEKYKGEFLNSIEEYLCSNNPWTVRVGLVILLCFYLDDEYIKTALTLSNSVHSRSYYVSMAQAWLTAEAFAKNEGLTMKFFTACDYDSITFNRTIQKARESRRVSPQLKEELKKMKRTVDKNK